MTHVWHVQSALLDTGRDIVINILLTTISNKILLTPASSNLVGKGLSRKPRNLLSGVPCEHLSFKS